MAREPLGLRQNDASRSREFNHRVAYAYKSVTTCEYASNAANFKKP